MMRQYELVEKVRSYDPAADEDAINRAYVYSMKAHGSQMRASGDPYFSHPIEVAGILTRYRLDSASIITALLHDTVEDTEATLDDIERLFGGEIAKLVDGVTKLSRIEVQTAEAHSAEARQAENFRKLLLAMSEDLRVLLVKLADRVHNMRTLKFINDPEKRRRIARETAEIYAPLAERIGMRDFQEELLDLAFEELNPDARASIIRRLDYLRAEGGNIVPTILDELGKTMGEANIVADVSGREKTPYSIWLKMQRKAVEFEQLSDIMAFRVVVHSIQDCYRALGVIHAKYPVVPTRFKDYISVPKPNGYRSLHTSVFGPVRQRIEIQIRTDEMHDIAEHGVAAHWHYKMSGNGRGGNGKASHGGNASTRDGTQYRWIRELLDILEHASEPEEFLEHTKLEMFQDQVFCFTPKGDLIALPSGATPVDFAYAVHSEVGDRCVGAKVNGRMVPLRTELHNGDQVEIVTSRAQTPSPEWERFVVTGKARARVRRFVRILQRQQYYDLGKAILEKAFRQDRHRVTGKAVEKAAAKLQLDSPEEVFVRVGAGHLTGREVLDAVFPPVSKPRVTNGAPATRPRRRAKDAAAPRVEGGVSIKGLIPGMALHYARCCHPLPGERIVGIVTTGKGVTVHTIDCETLDSFAETPERWLDLSWNLDSVEEPHIGRLKVLLSNEPGSLGDLSTVIGRNDANITNLKIVNRSADFFEMLVDVQVDDVRHLTEIIAALRASPLISSVERARG